VVAPRLANAPGPDRKRRMLYSVLLPGGEQPPSAGEPADGEA
jgi:hypothetical protein